MKNILFAVLIASLPLLFLAACNPSSVPTASTGLPLQGSANGKTMMLGNETYTLTEARSYPLIDQWTYSLPAESAKQWSKRIQIQRYKKVNADEIYDQMVGATKGRMGEDDMKSRTICFVTERNGGQLKEVNIWKYDDVRTADGKFTYANGISWQYPAGMAFNSFMKGEFPNTCESMRKLALTTMPPISE